MKERIEKKENIKISAFYYKKLDKTTALKRHLNASKRRIIIIDRHKNAIKSYEISEKESRKYFNIDDIIINDEKELLENDTEIEKSLNI